MNSAQPHLLTNHIPVIVPIVGLAVLIAGLWAKSLDIKKVGLWLFVVAALAAIFTYISGDSAEVFIKNYPEISRLAIDRHRVAAKIALVAIEGLGLLSAILLWLLNRHKISASLWTFTLVASAATIVLIARAAHFGGQIRHEELEHDPKFQAPS